MASDKLDQVANAIREVVWIPGCGSDNPGAWGDISDDAKSTWRAAARAAIEAWEAMIDAALKE